VAAPSRNRTRRRLLGDVVAAEQALRQSYDLFERRALRRAGLPRSDYRSLQLLVSASATPSEIAAELGLTSGSTTTLLDRLEQAGLVERRRASDDRRRVVVSATAEGRRRLHVPETRDRPLDSYSDEELELFADLLATAASYHRRCAELLDPN
jgi:DNA-binding MarR family transcriptional regulator